MVPLDPYPFFIASARNILMNYLGFKNISLYLYLYIVLVSDSKYSNMVAG